MGFMYLQSWATITTIQFQDISLTPKESPQPFTVIPQSHLKHQTNTNPLSISTDLPFQTSHILNRIIQYVFLCVWLLSLVNIMKGSSMLFYASVLPSTLGFYIFKFHSQIFIKSILMSPDNFTKKLLMYVIIQCAGLMQGFG